MANTRRHGNSELPFIEPVERDDIEKHVLTLMDDPACRSDRVFFESSFVVHFACPAFRRIVSATRELIGSRALPLPISTDDARELDYAGCVRLVKECSESQDERLSFETRLSVAMRGRPLFLLETDVLLAAAFGLPAGMRCVRGVYNTETDQGLCWTFIRRPIDLILEQMLMSLDLPRVEGVPEVPKANLLTEPVKLLYLEVTRGLSGPREVKRALQQGLKAHKAALLDGSRPSEFDERLRTCACAALVRGRAVKTSRRALELWNEWNLAAAWDLPEEFKETSQAEISFSNSLSQIEERWMGYRQLLQSRLQDLLPPPEL